MSCSCDSSCNCSRNTCGGIGVGTVLAAVLSWATWHSVLWAIINACFGWLYVIYWLLEYSDSVPLK